MKSTILFLAAISMVACISATVTEPSACDDKQVSFPVPSLPVPTGDCTTSPSVVIPSESTSTTMDLSNDISDLQNVSSSLNVVITQFSIDNSNHEFDWVSELDITVQGNGLPSKLLATYTQSSGPAPTELVSQVVMSSSDALTYLSSGPLNMTLTLQSQMMTACQAMAASNEVAGMTSLQTNATMCIGASGKVTKSL